MTTRQELVLNYHIEDMTREWLVGGLKQGDFIAKSDSTYTVPITLMALHHGEFAPLKIKVDAQMEGTSFKLAMGGSQAGQAPPSVETYQAHSAVRILALPRGRSTFVVAMGSDPDV